MAGRNGGRRVHAAMVVRLGMAGPGAFVSFGHGGPCRRQMGRQMGRRDGWRDGWRDCKYMVLAVVRTTGPLWQLRGRAGSGRVLRRALRALGKLPWLRRVMCGACRALACAGHGGPCMCEAWRAWHVRGMAGPGMCEAWRACMCGLWRAHGH